MPAAILYIAEHGVVGPHQGLMYFLSYPCACCCRGFLMELEHMTRARQQGQQSNLQECLAECAAALGTPPVDLLRQAKCTDNPSRKYHADPNVLLLTSSASWVRSNSEASPLSLSRLHATIGSDDLPKDISMNV